MKKENPINSKYLPWIILVTILVFSGIILLQRSGKMSGGNAAEASGATIELNQDNFTQYTGQGLILVDVWAEWCKPCKAMEPAIHALAEEMQGKAYVGKLDADANRKLVSELKVEVIPTLILYKDGMEVERFVGMKTKESLQQAMMVYLQDVQE